jgi:hypothetical protein
MNTKGEKLVHEMHLLWSNRWKKLNNKWKDPLTGKDFSREQAINIVKSRARKEWIKQITAEDSARRQSLQESGNPTS